MSLQANVGFAATNILFAGPLTKAEFDDDPTQDTGTQSGSMFNTGISAGMGFIWAINETFSFDLPLSYNWQNVKVVVPSMVYSIEPQMLGLRPKLTATLNPAGMPLRFTGGLDMLAAFNKTGTSYDFIKETNPNTTELSEFTIGPWLMANFEPLPILSLNAGLRYDAAFIKAHQDAWTGTIGVLPASYPDSDESTNYNAFVYEAGFAVNPFDFIKIYGKYGTQFRYPFLDQLVKLPSVTTTTLSINTDLEPEQGWTVEGGIGLNFKQFVKLDANIYYLKIDNEILGDALT